MKNIIRLEEAAMLGLGIYGLYQFQVEWWYYLLLFAGPDISVIGYLAGNKTGAVCYNLFHHKAVAISIFMAGFMLASAPLQIAGIILFGHSSLDRMFGFGLKHFGGFKYTHLGIIGK